jgi:hypothetical protein
MSQQEQLRRSYITLHLPASPAVGAGQATLIATHPMRIIGAQLTLSDTGTGAGATTVAVNQNGTALATSAALSVAQGAATKATKVTFLGTTQNYPGGERVNIGDTITVDVTAVPATTAPKAAAVILSVVQTRHLRP